MADFGTAQSISSSYGTLTFNAASAGLGLPSYCMFMLRPIEGADMPEVRAVVNDRSARSGAIASPFHKGAKYIGFDCLIIADTPAHRTTMRDHLLGVLDPLLISDGTYTWAEPGAGSKSHTVRLFESVEVKDPEGGVAGPKHATWQLIAYGVLGEDGFEDMEV